MYLNSLDDEEVGMKMKHNYQHMYDLCKQHMHSYVLVESHDGLKVDGIITGVDDEYVYMAVPIEQQTGYEHWESPSPNHYQNWNRYGYPGAGYPVGPGFGAGGFGGGGFGGYGGAGYGRPRRFRRLVLPLAGLAALSLLPWY